MTTPEERAKALMVEISPNGQWTDEQHDRIAAAIRQAENDKLEEAAKAADALNFESCEDDWEQGYAQSAERIAAEIRELKHKD